MLALELSRARFTAAGGGGLGARKKRPQGGEVWREDYNAARWRRLSRGKNLIEGVSGGKVRGGYGSPGCRGGLVRMPCGRRNFMRGTAGGWWVARRRTGC